MVRPGYLSTNQFLNNQNKGDPFPCPFSLRTLRSLAVHKSLHPSSTFKAMRYSSLFKLRLVLIFLFIFLIHVINTSTTTETNFTLFQQTMRNPELREAVSESSQTYIIHDISSIKSSLLLSPKKFSQASSLSPTNSNSSFFSYEGTTIPSSSFKSIPDSEEPSTANIDDNDANMYAIDISEKETDVYETQPGKVTSTFIEQAKEFMNICGLVMRMKCCSYTEDDERMCCSCYYCCGWCCKKY